MIWPADLPNNKNISIQLSFCCIQTKKFKEFQKFKENSESKPKTKARLHKTFPAEHLISENSVLGKTQTLRVKCNPIQEGLQRQDAKTSGKSSCLPIIQSSESCF